MSTSKYVPSALAAILLAVSALPALAESPVTTLATLLDRAQIEDLLVDYYGRLGSGRDDFGAFFLEDGVLDVNGRVTQGKKPIEELFRKAADGTPLGVGMFRVMFTNLKVVVNGAAATADVVWTGVNSREVTAAPGCIEQGRDHDERVKRDGRRYLKHRIITSDGGLPAKFVKSYQAC